MGRTCEKRTRRRRRPRRLSINGRTKGFQPVDQGLTPQEAIEEARRCLGSYSCKSCEVCSLLCPDLCITYDERREKVAIDLDYCKGCGICAAVCPKHAIVMEREE